MTTTTNLRSVEVTDIEVLNGAGSAMARYILVGTRPGPVGSGPNGNGPNGNPPSDSPGLVTLTVCGVEYRLTPDAAMGLAEALMDAEGKVRATQELGR